MYSRKVFLLKQNSYAATIIIQTSLLTSLTYKNGNLTTSFFFNGMYPASLQSQILPNQSSSMLETPTEMSGFLFLPPSKLNVLNPKWNVRVFGLPYRPNFMVENLFAKWH